LNTRGADLITNDPVRPRGYEGMGGLSRTIPGLNFEAASSHHANHPMEMEVDALTDVGHTGFLVDAQAITALRMSSGCRDRAQDAHAAVC